MIDRKILKKIFIKIVPPFVLVFLAEMLFLWIFQRLFFNPQINENDWFAAIVCILASIPGVLCGILAYVQTERLHKLEDRHHRPDLFLEKAVFSLEKCADQVLSRERYTAREYEYIEELKKEMEFDTENEGILAFYLQLKLRSGAVVDKVAVQQIDFCFPGIMSSDYSVIVAPLPDEWQKCAPDRNSFHTIYENGDICYKVRFDVYMGKQHLPVNFWNGIYNFLDYGNSLQFECRKIETNIRLKIYHEFSEKGYDEAMLRLKWEAASGISTRRKNYMYQETSESYFTYMIKK